jgi:PAS domain S-box-containing protein
VEKESIPENPEEIRKLVHELRVHQTELEVQNEELTRDRDEAEAWLEQYTELYELAPAGYFTVDVCGTIRQENLAGAGILGRSRSELTGTDFRAYLANGSVAAFNSLLHDVTSQPDRQKAHVAELTLAGSPPVFISVRATSGRIKGECLLAVTDITDRKKTEEALQKSGELYRLIADNTLDWVFWIDPRGKILYLSPSVEKITGLPFASYTMIQDYLADVVHPDDLSMRLARLDEALEGRAHNELEYRIVRPDGEVRWIQHTCRHLYDENGRFLGIRGSNRDITERKRIEEALAESEEKFRQVFFESGVGKTFTYADGRMEANRAFAEMLGYALEELNTIPWQTITHPDDLEMSERFSQSLWSGEQESGRFTKRYVHRNGSVVWGDVSAAVHRDRDGRPVYLIVTVSDITERKSADDASRAAREMLGIALHAAKAGTWAWEIPSGTLTWSPEFFGLFGLSPDTPASFETWLSVMHPDDRELAMARIDQSLKDHSTLWNEYRIVLPDGGIRWIGASGNTEYDGDGRPLRMSGICLDITERRAAEDALREAKERTAAVMAQIADGFYSLDRTWRFTAVNPAAEKAPFGQPAAELMGRVIWDIFPQLKVPDIYPHYTAALENQALERYEVKSPLNGRWYEVFVQGRTGGVDVYLRDINDRKNAEEALQESEERFRVALLNSPITVFSMDRDLRYTWIYNPPPGLTLQSVKGRTDAEIYSPEDAAAFTAIKQDVLESGEVRRDEIVTHRPAAAGGTLVQDLTTEPVRDVNGAIAGIICSAIDITERKEAEEELKHANRQILDIIEFLPDATYVIDQDHRVIAWNRLMETVSGVPKAEMLGKGDHEYAIPFYQERRPMMADIVMERNARYEQSYDVSSFDGEIFSAETWAPLAYGGKGGYFMGVATPLRDKQGKIVGAIQSIRDITERKHAEEALQETSQYLENLINHANAPIVVWGPDYRITRFNRAFEHLTGLSMEEVSGKTVEILIPVEYRDEAMNLIRETSTGERWETVEIPILTKDGSTRTVLWNSATVYDADGRTRIATIAQGQDITDRKKSEAALAESEEKFRILAINTPDTMTLQDSSLRYTTVINPPLGLTNQEMIGRNDAAFLSGEDAASLMSVKQKVLTTGQPRSVELSLRNRDGRKEYFEGSFVPRRDTDGRINGIFGYLRNVTESVETRERISQTLREKETLIREVHHRVKNNLQVISGLLDMTRMRTDDKTAAVLTDMMTKIQTMAQIHTRLYESRQFDRINMGDQIREQVTAMTTIYSGKTRQISCGITADEVLLSVDRAVPCALVINEILSNAFKHAFIGRTEGEIDISLGRQDGNVRITVSDDGIGMPADFDIGRSSSLGMKLIRTLVQHQLGGSLLISGGKGTVVVVEFPL